MSPRAVLAYAILIGAAALLCLLPFPLLSLPAAYCLTAALPGLLGLRLIGFAPHPCLHACLALAMGQTLVTVPLAWVWHHTNQRLPLFLCGLGLNLLLLALAAWPRRNPCCNTDNAESRPSTPAKPSRRIIIILALLCGWMTSLTFLTFCLPEAYGSLETTGSVDYIKHHAVMLSLEHHPLPLRNPFCEAAASDACYYYAYYYLLPATMRVLVGPSASIAMAFGLVSAIQASLLICLVFSVSRACFQCCRAALFAAACVSVIGGWDIVPIVIRWLSGGEMVITLDSWIPSPWRVHNLATQVSWCPHHVSAVLTLLVTVRLLQADPRSRTWLLLAPLAGTAIFGASTYLAMTIFGAAAVYSITRIVSDTDDRLARQRLTAALTVIAMLGLALMARQAWQYHVMADRFEGGLTWQWPRLPLAVLGRILPPGPLANLLDLPWILLLELGLILPVCLFAGRAVWRQVWHDPGLRLLFLAGGIGGPLMFVVRSDVNPIDYAFRVAIMPTQVAAAILAGAVLFTATGWLSTRFRIAVLGAGMLLGAPVGLYEVPLAAMRSRLLRSTDAGEAGGLRFLRDRTPTDAVILADPDTRVPLVQIIHRRLAAADPGNAHVRVFWPERLETLTSAADRARMAFRAPTGVEAWEHCAELGATYVLVGPAETRAFGPTTAFADERYFEVVYQADPVTIYRLRVAPPSP